MGNKRHHSQSKHEAQIIAAVERQLGFRSPESVKPFNTSNNGFLDETPARGTPGSQKFYGPFEGHYGDKSKPSDKAGAERASVVTTPAWANSKQPDAPTLLFTPYAWAKLEFMRDAGDTEVGGLLLFDAPYSMRVVDLLMCKQQCSSVTVEFDDIGLALLYDRMFTEEVDARRFVGFWWHTHPGSCAKPSGVDELTFHTKFGSKELAMMFILARGGQTSCRLRSNVGPGLAVECPVRIDYAGAFGGTNHSAWKEEYEGNVSKYVSPPVVAAPVAMSQPDARVVSARSDDAAAYERYWVNRARGRNHKGADKFRPETDDRYYTADDYYDAYIFGM